MWSPTHVQVTGKRYRDVAQRRPLSRFPLAVPRSSTGGRMAERIAQECVTRRRDRAAARMYTWGVTCLSLSFSRDRGKLGE